MNEQALVFSSISISSVSKRKLETKLEELQVSPTKKLKQALESIPTVLNKKSNEIEVGEEFEKVVKEFSDFRSKVSLFLFFFLISKDLRIIQIGTSTASLALQFIYSIITKTCNVS